MSYPTGHLDYTENDASEVVVFCTIQGCRWAEHAVWSDFGDDRYGRDWDQIHPVHEALASP